LKASDVTHSRDKVLEELEKINKSRLALKNLQNRKEFNIPEGKDIQLDGFRRYDNITFYDYGQKVGVKDGATVYKKDNYVLHVTKTRANSRKGLNAVNTVHLYIDQKYIKG